MPISDLQSTSVGMPFSLVFSFLFCFSFSLVIVVVVVALVFHGLLIVVFPCSWLGGSTGSVVGFCLIMFA